MEFIIALFATRHCFSLITSMIVDVAGLLFMISLKMPKLLKKWMSVTEWSGLRWDAASVTAISGTSLMMDHRTKLEWGTASIVRALTSRKRNDHHSLISSKPIPKLYESWDAYLILLNYAFCVFLDWLSKPHFLIHFHLDLISLLNFTDVGGFLLAKNAVDHAIFNNILAAGRT